LRNGDVLRVRGIVSAKTRLIVRYVANGRVRTARLKISGGLGKHAFALAVTGRHVRLRPLRR
jgi:hypothetical protein